MRKSIAILALLLAVCTVAVPADKNPIRILPLGDSITHGFWSNISTNAYNSCRKDLKVPPWLLSAEDLSVAVSTGVFILDGKNGANYRGMNEVS